MSKTMSATSKYTSSNLLSRTLICDAGTSVVAGIALLGGSDWLSPLLGLPTGLMIPAGVALLLFATVILAATSQLERSRRLVWAIMIGNLLWFAASHLVAFRWYEPTQLGVVIIVLQAVAALGLTVLELIGLRRLQS